MNKSSAVGLAICILLFLLLINMDDFYSVLNTVYCSSNLKTVYYHVIP